MTLQAYCPIHKVPVYPTNKGGEVTHDDIHVYPINDLENHVLTGTDCPCKPRVEVEGATLVIIHNAFDKREVVEQAEWS